MKFHENLSGGSRVVPCGRTDEQTYMKLIVELFAILRTRLKTKSVPRRKLTSRECCLKIKSPFVLRLIRSKQIHRVGKVQFLNVRT